MNFSRLYRRFAVVAIGLLLGALLPTQTVLAASTIYVGPGGGSGGCAVPITSNIATGVGFASPGDTVHVCADTYTLTGPISISGDLTIEGDGASNTFVDGANTFGIFATDSSLTINDITLRNGSDTNGAAVLAGGGSTIVTINRSTFANNNATAGDGGAVDASTANQVVVNSSTFVGNNASGNGGAIIAKNLNTTNSTFYGNHAGVDGGALYSLSGNASAANSTFSGNTAGASGTVIYTGGTSSFLNSIMASSSGNACAGTPPFATSGSRSTDSSCAVGFTVTPAELALQALANNGGPTQTMALGLGSVAIDGGLGGGSCPAFDQRALARPAGSGCDVGAFEAQITKLALNPGSKSIRANQQQSYLAEAQDDFGNSFGDVTSSTTFGITGLGSCLTNACGSTTHGSYTVTGTYAGTITGTSALNVTASKLVVTGPGTATAGTATAYTVTAQDEDGNTVADYPGTVTIASSDGAAAFSPTSSTLTNGTKDFDVTFHTAGSMNVGAHDGTLTATALPVTVGPDDLNHFTVVVASPQTAGAGIVVNATARDQYGNVVDTYSGTPTLTNDFSSTRGAPVDGTFPACSSGLCTSNANTIDYTAETGRHVTVTDGSAGGNSAAFTVNPATAATFAVSGFPGTTTAGDPHSVTVTAKDAFGNTDTAYAGTVHINTTENTNLPPDAGLTGGTGTFSVRFDTATTTGTVTISATDTVTASITGHQANIVVTAAALNHFNVTVASTQTQGAPFVVHATASDSTTTRSPRTSASRR